MSLIQEHNLKNNTNIIEILKTKNSIEFTLQKIILYNQSVRDPSKEEEKSIFSLTSRPTISLGNYLNRILKYTKLEESTLINSMIYMDRFCRNNGFSLTSMNVYK
jgi:hypothetical protein